MSGLPTPKIRGLDLLPGTKAPSTKTPAVVRTHVCGGKNHPPDRRLDPGG